MDEIRINSGNFSKNKKRETGIEPYPIAETLKKGEVLHILYISVTRSVTKSIIKSINNKECSLIEQKHKHKKAISLIH